MEEMTKQMAQVPVENVEHIVQPGNVENELLRFVRENDFDLVILGVNGNGQDNKPGKHAITMIEKGNAPMLVVPNSLVKDE